MHLQYFTSEVHHETRPPASSDQAAFAPIALAQQHTASVQPQVPEKSTSAEAVGNTNSGRDPFQLNWQTGRFDYVPVPYQQQPGAPYSPFQYNPFTGHFDYVPVPPPAAPDYGPRIEKGGGNASNYIDTRVNTQVPAVTVPQAGAQPNGEAMPASAVIAPLYEPPPPTEIYRLPIPPSPMKAPATRPAATQPAPAGAPPT